MMNRDQLKKVLSASLDLPVADARRVVGALVGKQGDDLTADIRSAIRADLQPLGKALAGALQRGDLAAMQAALVQISNEMPELMGEAETLAGVLAEKFTDSFLGEISN